MNDAHQFKKSLGQNFLKYPEAAIDLVRSLKPDPNKTIIEIGPGEGVVTDQLLNLSENLILIEYDSNLIDNLRLKYTNKATVIHEDILALDIPSLVKEDEYYVIGSLPYNISKKIISIFLTQNNKPKDMSFIVQKEVAESYASVKPKATKLSNFARLYSHVEAGDVIPKEHFFPEPKVDGQILTFTDISEKFKNTKKLWGLIRQGFSHPRKILAGNLVDYDKLVVKNSLKKQGVSETARAQELSLEEWSQLYLELNK